MEVLDVFVGHTYRARTPPLTTVNLPDSIYQESEALAATRGATVVRKELQGELGSSTSSSFGDREVELPVLPSS